MRSRMSMLKVENVAVQCRRHLLTVVKLLVHLGTDFNAQGGYYGNALQAASFKGYEKVVKLLVHEGADFNAQGGWFGNAQHAASSNGYEEVLKLLVDEGADVNAQGGEYGNALQMASDRGHESVAQLLAKHGAKLLLYDGIPIQKVSIRVLISASVPCRMGPNFQFR